MPTSQASGNTTGDLSSLFPVCVQGFYAFGVPQASCLRPLLFTFYASKLFDVIKVHLPTAHYYANDTQLYVSISPNKSTGQFEAVTAIQHCMCGWSNDMIKEKVFLNEKPCFKFFLSIAIKNAYVWYLVY